MFYTYLHGLVGSLTLCDYARATLEELCSGADWPGVLLLVGKQIIPFSTMSDAQFQKAVEIIRTMPNDSPVKVDQSTQLKVYGLYVAMGATR